MNDKLKQILETKREEIKRLKPKAAELRRAAAERNDVRSLYNALAGDRETLSVIAEIKKASPSVGLIVDDFDPLVIGANYEEAGASAISVLTDVEYFQGSLDYMTQVRGNVSIPVLRKDFILDECQIFEAAAAGADAILLIVAALEQEQLLALLDCAHTFQLDALVEVHDLPEMERALETDACIIGVNNRNLHTFEVDLAATEVLSEEIGPDMVLVSESGIKTVADSRKVRDWGADAILVGESLMRADDVGEKLRELALIAP